MKLFLIAVLLAFNVLNAFGQSTSTPFGPGGGSTSYIPSSGGGGSVSSAAALTNAPNFFTSTNAYTKPIIVGTNYSYNAGGVFYNLGIVNQSTNITTASSPTVRIILDDLNMASGGAQVNFGDYTTGTPYGFISHDVDNAEIRFGITGSGGQTMKIFSGSSSREMQIGPLSGQPLIDLLNSTVTIGYNSSSAETHNGTTASFPNFMNYNSDTFWFDTTKHVNIGTNSATSANLWIQGSGVSVTNAFIRMSATQQAPGLYIQGTNSQALFAFLPSGVLTFGSTFASSLTQSSALLNNSGGTVTIKNSSGTTGSTTTIASGTSSGGAVIFVTTNSVENGRFTASGFQIGPNTSSTVPISLCGSTNFTWTPGSISSQGSAATNMSVNGVAAGSPIMIGPTVFNSGLEWRGACTNAGVITVSIVNPTSGAIDPGVHTVRATFFNP